MAFYPVCDLCFSSYLMILKVPVLRHCGVKYVSSESSAIRSVVNTTVFLLNIDFIGKSATLFMCILCCLNLYESKIVTEV